MRSKFILVLLTICGTLIAAALFEFFLRLFLPPPENLAKLKSSSLFLLENKPDATFPYRREGEYDNLIKINSFGFRDEEFTREKPDGVFRIAVLGDSQEEALQVGLESTWQKVMARELSEESKAMPAGRQVKVESYNFGVSGYGTDQEWLTLREKVWSFSPDMVILAFSPNDVGDTYKNRLVRIRDGGIEVVSREERAGGSFLGRLARETYTYHLVVRTSSGSDLGKRFIEKIRVKILGFTQDERVFLSDAQLVQGPFEAIASQQNPPPEVDQGWQLVRALIADMRRQADARSVQFLITVNIPRAQVRESDWIHIRDLYKLDRQTSSPHIINDVLADIARQLGIAFYDPWEDAIAWRGQYRDLHFEQDAHFNENGHLFMGTVVAQYILDSKLIP